MAVININIQSLLNAGLYDLYTVNDTDTVGTVKSLIQTTTGVNTAWFNLVYDDQVLTDASTLASYDIVNGSVLRAANIISELTTLEDRQVAKLDLAALDRTAEGNPYNTYDINLLPSKYIGNISTPNLHPSGLVQGRPWVI